MKTEIRTGNIKVKSLDSAIVTFVPGYIFNWPAYNSDGGHSFADSEGALSTP